MLTSSLLDDCRNFITDLLSHLRSNCEPSFISGIIEIGGDAVSCLVECHESSDIYEKARLISCSLSLFKKLLNRVELAEATGIISGKLPTKECAKLISRLKSCLLDYNRRIDKVASHIPSSKTLFFISRLAFKTLSESDFALISEAIDRLFPAKAMHPYDRDSLREALKRKNYGDVFVITRIGDAITVGVAFADNDLNDPDRLRIDIMILPEYRNRGYFLEALEGLSGYRFRHTGDYVLSLYLPYECKFLERSCMRYGFKTEGIKRSVTEKRTQIVMSMTVNLTKT